MSGPTTDNEELFMSLEKYKEAIKYLHHQIQNQDLTPDEILAKEDVETNNAKAQILKSFTPNHEVERLVLEARIDELAYALHFTAHMSRKDAHKSLQERVAQLAPIDRGEK